MIHEALSDEEYTNMIEYTLNTGMFNSSELELRELCERLKRSDELNQELAKKSFHPKLLCPHCNGEVEVIENEWGFMLDKWQK